VTLSPHSGPIARLDQSARVAFPDGQSCLNLAAARLRYIAGTAWSAKCYMNMRPLYQPQVPQTEAVA
jgi:putative transposase